MNNISSYLQTALLGHSVGYQAYTMPSTTYLALFTNVPTQAAGSGVEVYAGDYARQPIAWGAPAPSSVQGATQIANTNTIRFPASANANNNWGTILGVAVMDAASGGNYLWVGPMSAATTINVGGSLSLGPGSLALSLD